SVLHQRCFHTKTRKEQRWFWDRGSWPRYDIVGALRAPARTATTQTVKCESKASWSLFASSREQRRYWRTQGFRSRLPYPAPPARGGGNPVHQYPFSVA